MGEASASDRRIRFGPYEADLTAGELRKEGRRLHLQEQPFQILAALLERPGQVVTRDELRERLWAGQTCGDFDQGLNTAVNKLRDALGDSTATPRFVETLPRRGYRFLFPLETQQLPVKPRMRRLKAWSAAGLLALAVTSVAVLLLGRSPQQTRLAVRRFTIRPPVPIATAPFGSATAISPDGRHIAFIGTEGKTRLWIQHFDQDQPQAIEGSEGVLGAFWSPDSKSVAFATARALRTVPVYGGLTTRICDNPTGFYYPAWDTTYGATF